MLLIDQNRFVTAFLELVETGAIDPFDIMKDLAIVANQKELAGELAKKTWFPILVDVVSECTKKAVTSVGDTVANAVLAAGAAPVFAVSIARSRFTL